MKEWLKRLQEEKVPVLVCLTFGDKLYAEHMKQGRHLKEEERYPSVEYMRHTVKKQLLVPPHLLALVSSFHVVICGMHSPLGDPRQAAVSTLPESAALLIQPGQ